MVLSVINNLILYWWCFPEDVLRISSNSFPRETFSCLDKVSLAYYSQQQSPPLWWWLEDHHKLGRSLLWVWTGSWGKLVSFVFVSSLCLFGTHLPHFQILWPQYLAVCSLLPLLPSLWSIPTTPSPQPGLCTCFECYLYCLPPLWDLPLSKLKRQSLLSVIIEKIIVHFFYCCARETFWENSLMCNESCLEGQHVWELREVLIWVFEMTLLGWTWKAGRDDRAENWWWGVCASCWIGHVLACATQASIKGNSLAWESL